MHEFPAGHSCGNVAGNVAFIEFLPTKADGSAAWDRSPTDVTDSSALFNVGNDWSTTAIARLATPLKVVHSSTCTESPTLELQLNTTVGTLEVTGSLTVGGVAIGPPEPVTLPSWTYQYTLAENIQKDSMSATVGFAVVNGICSLRGVVKAKSGFSFDGVQNVELFTLPEECRPVWPSYFWTYGGNKGSNGVQVEIWHSSGVVKSNPMLGTSYSRVSLLGISFPTF